MCRPPSRRQSVLAIEIGFGERRHSRQPRRAALGNSLQVAILGLWIALAFAPLPHSIIDEFRPGGFKHAANTFNGALRDPFGSIRTLKPPDGDNRDVGTPGKLLLLETQQGTDRKSTRLNSSHVKI